MQFQGSVHRLDVQYVASYIFVAEIVIREALNEGPILRMCICM